MLKQMSGMMGGMSGESDTENVDSGRKIPENAMQIINSELSKIRK